MYKLFALMGLMLSLNVVAADYLQDKHYSLLTNPVPVADKSKIEVVELFSYHCGHCFQFESVIKPWKSALPGDVVFKQMPAYWDPRMESWVKGYYTASILGILEKTHMPVFNAFQLQKKQFNSAQEWADFYVNYGVSADKVISVYNSFAVKSLFEQVKNRIKNNYKAQGTPELYIQGKYRIQFNDQVKSHEDMLKVADFLITEERKHLQK